MTGILGSSQSTRLWQFHFVCENREKERDRDTERQETETERKTEIQKQRGVSHKKNIFILSSSAACNLSFPNVPKPCSQASISVVRSFSPDQLESVLLRKL